MKKSKGESKKNKERKRSWKRFDVHKTLPFKFLVWAIVLLMILTAIFIFIYESKEWKDFDLKGKLDTLKWDLVPENVTLTVLGSNFSNANQTAEVNISWDVGNQTVNAILIDFEGIPNYCNYTMSNDLVFLENKTYTIRFGDSGLSCNETSFENVTGVKAYAQIHVNLTQISAIPNINFYKDDSKNNLIHLGDYFNAIVEINYSLVASPSNGNISVEVNNNTKNISILVIDSTWFGVQTFNLTAVSADGDVLDVNTNGSDMDFTITIINSNRPIPNDAPEFDFDDCEEFRWLKNTNKTIDFDDCWTDDGGRGNLEYTYGNLHDYEDNISIIELSGNRIKFVPDIGFNKSTYLYFYANDSKIRESARVDLIIFENVTNNNRDNNGNNNGEDDSLPVLEVQSFDPSGSNISIYSNTNKIFSIIARNYISIEWYLDGVLIIGANSLSYRFNGVEYGNYTLEARIVNGSRIDSKVWKIIIEDEEEITGGNLNIGEIVFYLIIVVLILIIFLVIWMFVEEKNKSKKKVNLGFGISVVSKGKQRSSSSQFNIPKG